MAVAPTGGMAQKNQDSNLVLERARTARRRNSSAERLEGLDAGAEMATFDGFTAVDTGQRGREILVITTPGRCDAVAERFKERGIKPEWEVVNPARIVQDVTRLIQKATTGRPTASTSSWAPTAASRAGCRIATWLVRPDGYVAMATAVGGWGEVGDDLDRPLSHGARAEQAPASREPRHALVPILTA